jgi:tetratricopeptide (TPR) repeat protein
MLAGAYQLAGDYDRARMEYVTCWRLDRNSDILAQARRSFHLAVVSHPRSPVILADTVQKVEDALRQTPNDAELLYIYGRGKEVQGEPDVALKAYQAAAAINALVYPDLKDRINSLSGHASTPAVKGESAQAKVAPTPPKGNQPGPPQQASGKANAPIAEAGEQAKNLADYTNIESKLRTNDIDGAQNLALALVEKDPHEAKGWLLLGRTHEKKGDLDQASVAYRQAAYLKDPEAKSALAQIDSSRVQPMFKEADEAAKKGDWVKASASLKDAVTIAPNLPIVHRKLSEALRQLGDSKEAQRESKKADDLEKDAK